MSHTAPFNTQGDLIDYILARKDTVVGRKALDTSAIAHGLFVAAAKAWYDIKQNKR